MQLNPHLKADLTRQLGVENSFELVNTYKGIPLASKATLEKIGDHHIEMSVEPPSSVCLLWESSTIILEDQHSLAITAKVASFCIKTGVVELADLNPTNRGFGIKEMVRVEPENPIPAKISSEDHTMIGEVLNISLTEIGIRTHSLGDPPLKIADTVRLALILTGKNTDPSGTIVAIQPEEGAYRLGIRFTLEKTVPNLIAHYITRRIAEIHRELQDAYNAAYQDATE